MGNTPHEEYTPFTSILMHLPSVIHTDESRHIIMLEAMNITVTEWIKHWTWCYNCIEYIKNYNSKSWFRLKNALLCIKYLKPHLIPSYWISPETSYPQAISDLHHLVFHRYSSQSQNYDSFLLQPAGSNCTGQSTRMPLVLKDRWNQLYVKLGDSNMIRGGKENICPHFLWQVYIITQCNSVR
jgi:hypothetical protein